MKRFALSVFCLAAAFPGISQDYKVKVNPNLGKSFSYDQFPFPEGVKVYDMDKKPLFLEPDQLTLIQVWSTCCGAEPEVWSRVMELGKTYKDRGLKTISINFENGTDMREQHRLITEFFTERDQPEHFFLDGLGYVIDLLKVPGFPTYYLVSEDKMVVFRTNGKDEEGLTLLEAEIQSRVSR